MVKIIPVIVDRYLPRLAGADEANALLNHVHRISARLNMAPDFAAWRIR